MDKGNVHIYCGKGRGKTTAAIGHAMRAASAGQTAIIVQFFKGREEDDLAFLKQLEPQIKLFRFEKFRGNFDDLTPEQRQEETQNMKNGFNYAKKVLVTEECDVLILDEVLGLLPCGIITADDLRQLIHAKSDGMTLIMTSSYDARDIWDVVDEVTELIPRKSSIDKEIQ